MHKIPLLFKCLEHHVFPEINPAAAWVLDEPSIAHRKYDGTCMLFQNDIWYARREVKPNKSLPTNFITVEYDKNTGKTFGWVPAIEGSFVAQWQEALTSPPMDCDVLNMREGLYESGTYELIGPKINNNPEHVSHHRLMPHKNAQQLGDIQTLELDLVQDVDQVYADLKRTLFYLPVEGVVFKDKNMQKMAKLRRKDFDFSNEQFHATIQESKQRQRNVLSRLFNR